MRILSLIIFLFLNNVSYSQDSADTISIYLTDGFDNDSVDFWINDTLVLKAQNLKSNLYYSLTGDPIQLIKKDFKYIINCSQYEDCIQSSLDIGSEIKLKLLFNNSVYEKSFNLSNGNHFIIGYVGVHDDLDIWQLNFEPGFE